MPAVLEKNSPISVRFPRVLRNKVSAFSRAKKQTQSAFIAEAVGNHIELEEWKISGIKKAIQEMKEGKKIDGVIAMEWFDSLGTKEEKPFPLS